MSKQKYSSSQKRMYHSDRALHPDKYGVAFNSPKHTYSQGFYDGANNNRSDMMAIKTLYGKKAACAYNMGRINGMKNRY